ncbi:T9SS type A sorting domain-containing protein [Formosa sp. PL04]|uniref:T9SS type A sorting domain-containing protein n=1 Tax=Formosa sp. PL04 TaxID=3081755 RepID=UPI002980EBB8|nr:T9SS type A sorting domain-containing protein [Formosa sp. PL04]MDW5288127.1 T9SS type A sorting domain-containing protein [Formosa sp. PL04]
MKTKLHKTLFISAFAFIGLQTVNAQTPYSGTPYGGKATVVGEKVGSSTKIQLENFDSLGDAFPNGFNTGGEPGKPTAGSNTFGTYWDKSVGNSGSVELRAGSDVDLEEDTDEDGNPRIFVTGNQSGEFQCFTVEFAKSGTYTYRVNYMSFAAAGKNHQAFIYNTNNFDVVSKVLFNTFDEEVGVLPKSDNDGATGVTFQESQPGKTFEVNAGTYVIMNKMLDGGPNFDYFTITMESVLGVEDEKLEVKTMKAYPNPAIDGRFNLSLDGKWDVYSMLGVKVLSGEGKSVDLSTYAKGAYILKAENNISKMLISK